MGKFLSKLLEPILRSVNFNLQALHYQMLLPGCTTPPSVSSINRILRTRAAERAAEELTMMLETQERMRESLNVRLLQSHTQPPPTTPPIYPIPLLQPFWSGTPITLDNLSRQIRRASPECAISSARSTSPESVLSHLV